MFVRYVSGDAARINSTDVRVYRDFSGAVGRLYGCRALI
jgi:hypothetical protein